MGIPSTAYSRPASTQEILNVLANAEKMFWSEFALVSRRGKVFQLRDAAVSLALAKAFEVALGKVSMNGAILAARLLGEHFDSPDRRSLDRSQIRL